MIIEYTSDGHPMSENPFSNPLLSPSKPFLYFLYTLYPCPTPFCTHPALCRIVCRYVLKRPGVDYYLRELGRDFEIVVYTASLSKYATRDSSFII